MGKNLGRRFVRWKPPASVQLNVGCVSASDEQIDKWITTMRLMPTTINFPANSQITMTEQGFRKFLISLVEDAYSINPDEYGNDTFTSLLEIIFMRWRNKQCDLNDTFYGDWLFEILTKRNIRLGIYTSEWNGITYFHKRLCDAFVAKKKTLYLKIFDHSGYYGRQLPTHPALDFINNLPSRYIGIWMAKTRSVERSKFIIDFINCGKIATRVYNDNMQEAMFLMQDRVETFGANSVNIAKYLIDKKEFNNIDLNKFNEKAQVMLKRAMTQILL